MTRIELIHADIFGFTRKISKQKTAFDGDAIESGFFVYLGEILQQMRTAYVDRI